MGASRKASKTANANGMNTTRAKYSPANTKPSVSRVALP